MARPLKMKDADDRQCYVISKRAIAKGVLKKGRPSVWIRFPPTLFNQIREEAIKREISFTAVVIELCEASIEGIE